MSTGSYSLKYEVIFLDKHRATITGKR
jgi:hypothetical protein